MYTTVKIQFSTQHCWDSSVIRRVTWDGDSHVDMVLPPDGLLLGARLSGGVQIREPKYSTFTSCHLKSIEIPEENAQRVYDAAISQIGKPYDKMAILNFALHRKRDWRETRSWICSELIAWVFEEAGWPLINPEIPVDHISPRDLKLSLRYS